MKNEGWICPKCGTVHNPNVSFCPCSSKGHCYHLNVSINEIEAVKRMVDVFEKFKNNSVIHEEL